jgi:predicted MFS family arabinose efflux permease
MVHALCRAVTHCVINKPSLCFLILLGSGAASATATWLHGGAHHRITRNALLVPMTLFCFMVFCLLFVYQSPSVWPHVHTAREHRVAGMLAPKRERSRADNIHSTEPDD